MTMFRSPRCPDSRLAPPRWHGTSLVSVAALFALVLNCLAALPASAQQGSTPPVQHSYINPFPTGDRYRILVIGDSLGDDLWQGLYRAFQEDKNLEFINRSKATGGLVRSDSNSWESQVTDILKNDSFQIAVMMFGANDDQAIKTGKDWLKVGSEPWRQAYGERVEAIIKKLRAANIAVYWVGLPVMRSPDQSADAEMMNEVFREKAFINSAKYIDTWNGFTDESGRFSAYGPDMSGQVKRLRSDDGVHFTERGSLKLAHFVEKEMRRDLSLAKLERNIPLAGSEEEQAKMMGREVAPTKRADADQPAESAAPAPDQSDTTAQSADAPTSADGAASGDAASDTTPPMQQNTVGEVSVVRPAMDSTLQAAQGLLPQAPASSLPEPEMITSELGNGLTAVATLSSVTDFSLNSSKPRLPLAQRPYYKVLIKGEQLKPKSGRADDFAWPPS